jgi:hypothetical protein
VEAVKRVDGADLLRCGATCGNRPSSSPTLANWLAALVSALILLAAPGHADVDGSVPGPGLCSYPGTCTSGAAFGEYDYASAFPTEINGSHWQCLYGGAMYSGNAGVSIMFFNASITSPLGVLRGACWWACPDAVLSLAEQPRPPGAWKNYMVPSKCKPIGAAPLPIKTPDSPPAPAPDAAPLPSQAAPLPGLPNQTNPVATNPFETESDGQR